MNLSYSERMRNGSSSRDEEMQMVGFTNGTLKCHDSFKGLSVRKSLHCQKEQHEKKIKKNTEAVIIYVSGEKPVISCILGF